MLSTDLGNSLSIATAVFGALVAVVGVVGYQSRRARLSAIRSAFNDVVAALASENNNERLAGAVLLRRFFDARSELGLRKPLGRRRGAPYAVEALSVMAAVLRGLPTGDLQKLLADGLAFAPTLAGADLQRTNLQGAYLSPRDNHATLEGADFFRADLSGASMRDAKAANAAFYEARLRGTVFKGADLSYANFYGADLTDAVFTGATLSGAAFGGATNVPKELLGFLGSDGRYESDEPAQAPDAATERRPRVFISVPSTRSPAQESIYDRVTELIARRDLQPEVLTRVDYPPSDAMGEIYRRMCSCAGVLVLGFRGDPSGGEQPSGVSAWTHLEAGMAYASNLPLLIIREPGVRSGAFDAVVAGHRTWVLDLDSQWNQGEVDSAMIPWSAEFNSA